MKIAVLFLILLLGSCASPAAASDPPDNVKLIAPGGFTIGSEQNIWRVTDEEMGVICYYFSDPSHGFGQMECLRDE